MTDHAALTVRTLELASLKPHPRNPRQHPEPGTAAWDTLRASLEHDYFDPLVHNERNGFLVSGHLRTKVLAAMGVTRVDCVIVDYDEPTHLARMIAANQQIGTWDDAALTAMLKECDDLALAGFTDEQFLSLTAEAAIPEGNKPIDEEAMTKTENSCPSCGFRW